MQILTWIDGSAASEIVIKCILQQENFIVG